MQSENMLLKKLIKIEKLYEATNALKPAKNFFNFKGITHLIEKSKVFCFFK